MNLIIYQQPDAGKIYLFKDPFESKYQLIINEREKQVLKMKSPKAFIDYPQTIDDVYENPEDYKPTNKRKVLIVFDNIIVDVEAN